MVANLKSNNSLYVRRENLIVSTKKIVTKRSTYLQNHVCDGDALSVDGETNPYLSS